MEGELQEVGAAAAAAEQRNAELSRRLEAAQAAAAVPVATAAGRQDDAARATRPQLATAASGASDNAVAAPATPPATPAKTPGGAGISGTDAKQVSTIAMQGSCPRSLLQQYRCRDCFTVPAESELSAEAAQP